MENNENNLKMDNICNTRNIAEVSSLKFKIRII